MEHPPYPNTGRILDYWLGGSHHFPPDVGAAQAFTSIYDQFPKVFGLLREYIGRSCRYVAEQGVDQFLVLGAGIPTQGNVHEAVPHARVMYTDIDPTNVQLGQEILAEVAEADYAACDATDLASLDRARVDALLDLSKPVGLVFVGIAAFIPDEKLKEVFDQLYAMVAPGSYIIFDFDGEGLGHFPQALEMLAAGGEPLYMRTPETIEPLLGRWELTAEGIQPVDEWRNSPESPHRPVFMYGCVARRD